MSRYLSWLANSVLFVLSCFFVAETANTVFASVLTPRPDGPTATAAPQPAGRSWTDRQVILSRNLFNASLLAPAAPAPPENEELEATRLPLVLLGTAAAARPELSVAAIADKQSGETRIVRVQDEIKPQVTVLRIERRRIVISENGAPRELALEESNEGIRVSTTRAVPRARAERLASARRVREVPSIERENVEKMVRNPAALFAQGRVLPHFEDGEFIGVQVSDIKPGSIYEEVGIQDGDVIVELNGIAIDGPEQSAKVLAEFARSSEFTIVVENGDSTRTLNVTIPDE